MKRLSNFIVGLFLIGFLASSGCVTYKRCLSKFPPTQDTIRTVIVKDSIIYRDTTIYIKLPGEKVVDSVLIPCPDVPGYVPKKVYAETSLAKASAWWSYPNIKLELIQKDTTIERRLDNALKDAFHWRSEYEKVTVKPQDVKYIPGFYKFCTFAFIGLVIAILGFIAFKIFKP